MAITCQLIYSDGGETGLEDLWKIFPIALAPFVLGASFDHVTMYLDESLVDLRPEARATIERMPVPSGTDWLPDGYGDYFWKIYENALDVKRISDAPSCHFRVLSGHGFHDFQHRGHIRCGLDAIPFSQLGRNASILTILDICNSPHAVSVSSGMYPQDNPKKFRWKRAFQEPAKLLPVVCDKSATTWAFRVGFRGQDDPDNDIRSWSRMTGPIGDAVTCCVLAAIQTFTESREEVSQNLDDLIAEKYCALKCGYLGDEGTKPRRVFSKTSKLQTLIENGTISINQAAFDCELFRRSDKWFLTTERVVEVDPDDTEFANSLIDYVVTSVKVWHENNPNSMGEIEEAREAWMKILKMLGPMHRQRLRSKELEFTKDEGQNEKLILSDEGILIEAFAASCADLRRVEVAVRKWITYGDPSVDSDESELDDP